MPVASVDPKSFKLNFGFNYEKLGPEARSHEGSPKFKKAFAAMFDEDVSGLAPNATPMVMHAPAPVADSTGHFVDEEVRKFLQRVLNEHSASGSEEFEIGPDIYAICIRVDDGGWLVIGGYKVMQHGAPWLLGKAVDKYKELIGDKSSKLDESSEIKELRTLQVLMWTEHVREHTDAATK